MKLLIVTQVVDRNDPILGFFHRWIEEFAKHCESVEVICLREGEYSLPKNVHVYSLGKERGPKPSFVYGVSFLRKAYSLRNQYDTVFVHMNVEYVLLAGLLWKTMKKKISLWYTHGTVSTKLRVAVALSDVVFTASPLSLRLETNKKRIMGHGMDQEVFPLLSPPEGRISFITVGRVSAVKNLHVLIEVLALLKKEGLEATLSVIGDVVTEKDVLYKRELEELVEKEGLEEHVRFLGSKNKKEIQGELSKSHAFLHASSTGSLDKAPLEALLCGVPVVSTNQEIGGSMTGAYFANQNTEAFAALLKKLMDEKPWGSMERREAAREYVVTHHGLKTLIERLVAELSITRSLIP